MAWTKIQIAVLIEEYNKYPCLYATPGKQLLESLQRKLPTMKTPTKKITDERRFKNKIVLLAQNELEEI